MTERTSERSDSLVESHKGYDLRLLFFYPAIGALLLVLVGGLAYQQLIKTDEYHQREKQQNQRRILTPGPRGNIFDRDGRLLVKNRARFYAAVNLDELRDEFRLASFKISRNYRDVVDSKEMPSSQQLRLIARYNVVQSYLDKINQITGRSGKVDAAKLNKHFSSQLLLPYTLADELTPDEYARLLEQLPVTSPLQVYAESTREYPYKASAAHTLGYVRPFDELNEDDFPGQGLSTLKMRGTIGKDGLEARFNDQLQGKAGGAIYRVDPSGYRIDPPLDRRLPVQGHDIKTSLDIDLQLAAEQGVENAAEVDQKLAGAVVAIDVKTGEVLALASMPNYDLNNFNPRLTTEDFNEMTDNGAWSNRAIQGLYPPGSTFKILIALAAYQSGAMKMHDTVTCNGTLMVGKRAFPCHGGFAHGEIGLERAIAKSCNIFFMTEGLAAGPEAIASEAKLFHFGEPTNIELLHEARGTVIPSPEWKERTQHQKWFPGDTANTSIGQGYVLVTPLQMACFAASIARGETYTPPTLLHDPDRPRLHTTPIGLPAQQYASVMAGMRECVESGTARRLNLAMHLNAYKIAGKTGTAQKAVYEHGVFKGNLNYAWFMGFAPYDDPQIAIVVMLEGNVPGEEYGGGDMAAPVAGGVFQKFFEKHPEKAGLPPPKALRTASVP